MFGREGGARVRVARKESCRSPVFSCDMIVDNNDVLQQRVFAPGNGFLDFHVQILANLLNLKHENAPLAHDRMCRAVQGYKKSFTGRGFRIHATAGNRLRDVSVLPSRLQQFLL